MNIKSGVLVCVFGSLMATGAWAQTAQIVGTISDASGARVPEASVSVSEVNTGNTRTVSYELRRLLYHSPSSAGNLQRESVEERLSGRDALRRRAGSRG